MISSYLRSISYTLKEEGGNLELEFFCKEMLTDDYQSLCKTQSPKQEEKVTKYLFVGLFSEKISISQDTNDKKQTSQGSPRYECEVITDINRYHQLAVQTTNKVAIMIPNQLTSLKKDLGYNQYNFSIIANDQKTSPWHFFSTDFHYTPAYTYDDLDPELVKSFQRSCLIDDQDEGNQTTGTSFFTKIWNYLRF